MVDVIDCSTTSKAPATAPELSRLNDDQLTVGYDDALATCHRAEWVRLAYEAEIERRRMWRADGTTSLRAWIGMRTGEGERAAFHQANVARSLPDFPALGEALADGRLGVTHVRLLLTLAELTGAGEAELVAAGERHTVPQLETACRAARRLHRRVDQAAHERRYVRWWCDDGGTFHLRGRLHGTDGLTVTGLLSAMAEEPQPDPATGVHDPFEARCADALVDLCTGSDGTPNERAAVVIHAPVEALDARGAGGVPMTWDGTVIANDTLRRLACDTRLRLTLDDAHGRAVGIGRRSRTIPNWLVGQLRWRDQRCRFPGCERTRWLHGHHVWHWADGGQTSLDNLVLLCTRHHRGLHEGGWRLSGSPDDELHFTSPRGLRYSSRPAIRPEALTTRRHRAASWRQHGPPLQGRPPSELPPHGPATSGGP